MTKELKKELHRLLKKVYFKGILEQKDVLLLVMLAQQFIDTESHNYPDKIKEVIEVKNYFEKRLKEIPNDTN